MEAISCLLNFSTRGISTSRTPPAPPSSEREMVRTFRTSTPRTPAASVRPERPPRIASRRILPLDLPRPRPLRRPPAAALGAPPQQEEEESIDLPDIPDTPQSPTVSDITVHRLVLFFILVLLFILGFLKCFMSN